MVIITIAKLYIFTKWSLNTKVCLFKIGSSRNFVDNFVSFQPILLFFLHFIDFGEHFIVIERNLKFGEKKDEKNEDENFQLLYYLSYMIKNGIGGFPQSLTITNMQMIPH